MKLTNPRFWILFGLLIWGLVQPRSKDADEEAAEGRKSK